MSEIKFTEEELKQVGDLQVKYNEVTNKLGQYYVIKSSWIMVFTLNPVNGPNGYQVVSGPAGLPDWDQNPICYRPG